jgi:hypothetical protein
MKLFSGDALVFSVGEDVVVAMTNVTAESPTARRSYEVLFLNSRRFSHFQRREELTRIAQKRIFRGDNSIVAAMPYGLAHIQVQSIPCWAAQQGKQGDVVCST